MLQGHLVENIQNPVLSQGSRLPKTDSNLCFFQGGALAKGTKKYTLPRVPPWEISLPLALESLFHRRWMLLALKLLPLALKLEFQCQKKPALKSALEFAIGVETCAFGVETAPIGVETAPIGVEIGVESCHWR